MGSALGRTAETQDDNAPDTQAAYKFQYKTGPYFGSHFMLGDERFESAQPECFLFGENKDLNFLQPKPVTYPYSHQCTSEPYQALNCATVVRRDSVRFVNYMLVYFIINNGTDATCYNIEFVFDTDVPCSISIHYFCTETVLMDGLRYTSKKPELSSAIHEYDIGANQVFSDQSHVFDPCLYKSQDLQHDGDKDLIPIVIHCIGQPTRYNEKPQHHSTLMLVERSCENTGFLLKPYKQKIVVDDVCYVLQEVYGLENKNVPKSLGVNGGPQLSNGGDGEDYGAECVVCMTEWRDTLILPCRHLCICSACAESLRYKTNNCPICRSPFKALLQIKTVRFVNSVRYNASSDNCVTTDMLGNLKRYELVPLVEALNGPMALMRLPVYTVTPHSTPATCAPSPSTGANGATSSRKAARPTSISVQEVLTPDSVIMRVYDTSDKLTCFGTTSRNKPSMESTSSVCHTSL